MAVMNCTTVTTDSSLKFKQIQTYCPYPYCTNAQVANHYNDSECYGMCALRLAFCVADTPTGCGYICESCIGCIAAIAVFVVLLIIGSCILAYCWCYPLSKLQMWRLKRSLEREALKKNNVVDKEALNRTFNEAVEERQRGFERNDLWRDGFHGTAYKREDTGNVAPTKPISALTPARHPNVPDFEGDDPDAISPSPLPASSNIHAFYGTQFF